MSEQETFTTRLRRHRERRKVPLDVIARETRVKLELLEGLEGNDMSAWPRGLYARAYVRAYAAAIGLDADETVNEFCRLFPQGDRRAHRVIREMAAIVASPSEYRDEYEGEADRRRPSMEAPPAPPTRWEAAFGAVKAWVSGLGRSPVRQPRTAKGLRHNA